uniref:Uncharacterized protein n=1 Tax=Avena sativa TaxID=4498 RepID=A0ACD6A3W9_AVESA
MGYIKTLRDIVIYSTDTIMKGKQPLALSDRPVRPPPIAKLAAKPWLRPPEGWVKLTIDGSFCMEDDTAGTGMVLRDSEGTVIFSACRFIPYVQEAFAAELYVCSEGLAFAFQHTDLPIIVDRDCTLVVSAV